jgi:hypothetical protein
MAQRRPGGSCDSIGDWERLHFPPVRAEVARYLGRDDRGPTRSGLKKPSALVYGLRLIDYVERVSGSTSQRRGLQYINLNKDLELMHAGDVDPEGDG